MQGLPPVLSGLAVAGTEGAGTDIHGVRVDGLLEW